MDSLSFSQEALHRRQRRPGPVYFVASSHLLLYVICIKFIIDQLCVPYAMIHIHHLI